MQSLKSPVSLEILIISFDGFSDVWDLCINSLFEFWPDCPFRINLLTNAKIYPDLRVNSLCVGPDEDWSSSLIRGLNKIQSDYVLTLFDDFIIKEKINANKINELIQVCVSKEYNYLRLRPAPPPDRSGPVDYGPIKQGAPYRVSLCTAIIKKKTLLSLLQPGESPWDFEKFGSLRSAHLGDFYSARNQWIPYHNAIEKGKWNESVLTILKQNNIDIHPRGKYQPVLKGISVNTLKHFIVFTLMPVFLRRLFYRLQKNWK